MTIGRKKKEFFSVKIEGYGTYRPLLIKMQEMKPS
jgi:hypothetical protein